jgi:cholesterol transport system auxiliary component
VIPTRPLLALGAAVVLAGCISLAPKSDPIQLYRFGAAAPAEPVAAPADRPVVRLAQVYFPRASASDRILTVTGAEAAYAAGARWVAPADVLFREAVLSGFSSSGGASLVERGGNGVTLELSVRSFETRYDRGDRAAPLVVVETDARLVRSPGREVIAERKFSISERASQNRLGAIVESYDAAVSNTVAELSGWTAAQVR